MHKNPTVSELNAAQAAKQSIFFRHKDNGGGLWVKDGRDHPYTEYTINYYDLKIEGTPAPVVYVNEYSIGKQWGASRFASAEAANDAVKSHHRDGHVAVRRLVLDPDFKFVPKPVSRITRRDDLVEFKPNGSIVVEQALTIYRILKENIACDFRYSGHRVVRVGNSVDIGCVKGLTWEEISAFAKEQGWS